MEKVYFIVDDDAMQNEIHSILLKKVDPAAEVYTFLTAKAALKFIDTGKVPDVVFLDLHIPGEEENSFLEAHKVKNYSSDIYLMSSVAYLDNPSLAKNYPAVKDFISKPLLDYKLRSILSDYA